MVSYKKHLLKFIFIFLLNSFFCFGQGEIDTLQNKTLQELFDLHEKTSNSDEKIRFIEAFIHVAKKEKKKKRILAGYHILSYLHNDERILTYSDSIISLTSKTVTKFYPSIAYRSKAQFYHLKGNFKKAIDNYLLSNEYAVKQKNEKLIADSKYSLATIKRIIGEYESALELYRENLNYTKKTNNNRGYLLSLISISNIFYELERVDSATHYNRFGVSESLRLKDSSSYHHFRTNQGVIEFLKQNYNLAIETLEKKRLIYEKLKDEKNLSYIYYYLGKSYEEKGNVLKSISFFKKNDSIFQIEKDVSLKTRDSYESLINFYKNRKNYKKQLFYVNRLIKFDSLSYIKNLYLNKKIFKEYDIPKLNSEKQNILKKFKKDEMRFSIIILVISIILLITFGFLINQNKKRKLYKKRFEEIINPNSNPNSNSNSNSNSNIELNIPKEIIDNVLSELNYFEIQKGFISKKITLNSLAEKLNTNTNYLSKIINHYKKVSFSNYLNSLRIEFIIIKLQSDSTIRRFTIKAISEEAGFNNSESFSKAFYKIKGIKPSYFLKELENKIELEN